MKALLAILCLLAALCVPMAAQDPAVLAGYELLYEGQADKSYEHFRALAQKAPDSLPALFGIIDALQQRVRDNPAALPELETRLDQFIERAEARRGRNKKDGEALMYLARAYMERGRYRFEHSKGMWSAARDGAKSKHASDDYLKLPNRSVEADFALGVYNYYVSLAPSFVKVLRVLMFLPSADRAAGLRQMERVAAQGRLWGPAARLMLMEAYAQLEGRPHDGVRMGTELLQLYPQNADYRLALADLFQEPPLEDPENAAQQFSAALQHQDGSLSPRQRARATLGLAMATALQWRHADAINHLTAAMAQVPTEPSWAMPRFLLLRGNFRFLLNEPNAADDARRILADAKWREWHKAAQSQLDFFAARNKTADSAAYVALLPANRFASQRKWHEARVAYEQVRQQYPNDPQVRYRIAHLDFASGQIDAAAPVFQQLSELKTAPEWVRAQSLLYLGRIADLRNQREQAVRLYQRVTKEYEQQSAARAARLGVVGPYRRPA
jgi:tetratricopeptide (TPR) repeat protein